MLARVHNSSFIFVMVWKYTQLFWEYLMYNYQISNLWGMIKPLMFPQIPASVSYKNIAWIQISSQLSALFHNYPAPQD